MMGCFILSISLNAILFKSINNTKTSAKIFNINGEENPNV